MTRSVQQLFELTGKTALLTGGSRGLELQIIQAVGEAEVRVLVSARKAAELESAATALQAQGVDAQRLDILVNNAGPPGAR